MLSVRARLHAWAIRRIGFRPGEAATPLSAARRHLGATLVLAALHPSWPGWWIAPYLALPGDRFRDPSRMLELEVIGCRRPGRVLARVVPDELVARGWKWDTLPRVDLVAMPGRTIRAEVREVDLRGGWQRA